MTWKIERKVEDDGYDYRTTLIITDSSGTREYSDGGEPEDNTFGRDWNWVAKELEKAYQEGKKEPRE